MQMHCAFRCEREPSVLKVVDFFHDFDIRKNFLDSKSTVLIVKQKLIKLRTFIHQSIRLRE